MSAFDDMALQLARKFFEGITKKVLEDDIGIAKEEASVLNTLGWDTIQGIARSGIVIPCPNCNSNMSRESDFCPECIARSEKLLKDIVT